MMVVFHWIGPFLYSFLAFVMILVPLVVFHELGHYCFARLFGVKAEAFSIGFGPTLWSRVWGETEWRLSAIPLGGYVKLLGEDRDAALSVEDRKRSLYAQAAWKRFLIFFGGPFFNFILSIFVFMVILGIGEPQIANVIGRVVHQSFAEKVGFRSGDRIIAIHSKPIHKFEEILVLLNEHPNQALMFTVLHQGSSQPVEIQVAPTSQAGFSLYGEKVSVGDIDGLLPMARGTQIGVADPQSIVGRLGLKTRDTVISIAHQPVVTWEAMESIYQSLSPGNLFTLEFKKSKTGVHQTVSLLKPLPVSVPQQETSVHAFSSLSQAFGLRSSELFIDKIVPHSPAELAGLQTGDRIVRVGNQKIHSFFELKDAVQKQGETMGTLSLHWEREGRFFSKSIQPMTTQGRDPILNKTTQYTIGIVPLLSLADPVMVTERVWNPFRLIYLATTRVFTLTARNLTSLRKMITGDVSVGSIGGPLMIGKIAGESLTRGLIVFLTNMAIFSIGLGVLNLLPVPILDGGHLLLLGVEAIRGKALTLRQMEIIQSVGLIFILALMGIAFHNDVARFISS